MRRGRSLVSLVAVGTLAAGILAGMASSAFAADPIISTNKPTTTSSVEDNTFNGAKAVDGDAATRWASKEGHDPEFIVVDLGNAAHISRVVLRWEAAFGKAYQIQTSNDGATWTDIFATTTGDGDVDDLTGLNGTGRFVRMNGTKRGTAFGYSLFEFEVHGVIGPVDTQPPTPPANLRQVSPAQPTSIELAWDAATDNIGVASYEVFNGGNVIAEVGGNVLTAVVRNLTPNTRFIITVEALDGAGNPSQASNSLDITTPKSDDNQPPTVPTNLHATKIDATSITLGWTASTDNTGVAAYEVSRDGVVFATVPDLTATADGLAPNSSHTFAVRAKDANGNTSAFSPDVVVKTAGTGGGGDPIFDRQIAQLDLPWGIVFLPDTSALVAERDRFEIVRVTLAGQKTTLGKIPGVVTTGGEGGLLGLALSPNFATDHWLYVYHTSASDNRVVRIQFDNGVLGTTTEPIVTGLKKNQFHNGGRIAFGPDGMLYIGTGDAKNSNLAQDLNSLNGKILRVTPTGQGAPGNPFPSAPRVYSLGHRNVQGLAWDSRGRLWESELGESAFDEVNLIQAGKNYGWPVCEGECNNANFVNPVQQFDVASASPSGIEIVNDFIYMAAIRGSRLWVMHIQGNTTDTPRAFFNGRFGRLRTVIKTPDGGLWLTSTNNDKNGGTPDTIDNVIVRLKFAGGNGGGAFQLTSTAFADNGNIPTKYTCQQDAGAGNDISPPLAWGPGTSTPKSYAIVLVDTANNKQHWAVWDVPAATTTLPEGLGKGFNVPDVAGAKQKAMGAANVSQQFFGPCPGGNAHKYEFRLYALNVTTLPGLSASSTVAQVETAAQAGAIGTVKLSGTSAAHT